MNCPECAKPLALRNGKNGKFWGCTGYPNCRYTKPEDWPAPKPEQAPAQAKPITTPGAIIPLKDNLFLSAAILTAIEFHANPSVDIREDFKKNLDFLKAV